MSDALRADNGLICFGTRQDAVEPERHALLPTRYCPRASCWKTQLQLRTTIPGLLRNSDLKI
jgi:hypothetical protein